MNECQLLVVAPAGWNSQILSRWHAYLLEYRLVDSFPADGFSAWKTCASDNLERVDVAASCHSYSGGYTQHALNRFYSQALLRLHPKLVVIVGLTGCTVDLTRVADLLNIPVVLVLDAPAEALDSLDEATRAWLKSSLAACKAIVAEQARLASEWPESWLAGKLAGITDLEEVVDRLMVQSLSRAHSDYSLYEFCQRDHPLLVKMQREDTKHFAGCNRVLDLACGVGIFLDCLRQAGIAAEGVERDFRIAQYAQGMGLNVTVADASEFLDQSRSRFDGIYCSHFVEHLPIEAVQRILQLMARRISMGGVLVLVFPDPESIRSQLLGFWRDPEHVRFYHPELITLMAATAGLELEWSSHMEQPHRVVPFTAAPPPIPQSTVTPVLSGAEQASMGGFGERVLRALGLVSERRFRRMEERMVQWSEAVALHFQQKAHVDYMLEARTSVLWDVNQTWYWNDNVTLRLRKTTD